MNIKGILLIVITCFLIFGGLRGQSCLYWSEPDSLSDSNEDNRNAVLARIGPSGGNYYVFWDRFLEVFGSEIVCMDYYTGEMESVVLAEGYTVSQPQVLPSQWYPYSDTLAFIFYETNQAGNGDIYMVAMTDSGFTDPAPFVNAPVDEQGLRVSYGGGMAWQEGEAIRYCKLGRDASGFFFSPVVTIDSGGCGHPDIHKTDLYNPEGYIAWEKTVGDTLQVWFCAWDFDNDEWGDPQPLFPDGSHSGPKFSRSMELASWNALLMTDYMDSQNTYRIHAYDCYWQDVFISEFLQPMPFQPDVFTIDLITADSWEVGYLAFRNYEGGGNTDIYTTDYPNISPWLTDYCRLDSTGFTEENPQLFEGAWGFDYFDLICIWESYRNGHRQLFTAKTEVIIGGVAENRRSGDLVLQAYPNPFADGLWLEFIMKEDDQVRAEVFNVCGQLVWSLQPEMASPGKNLVRVATGGFHPGIYLVRLTAGPHQSTLKVIKE